MRTKRSVLATLAALAIASLTANSPAAWQTETSTGEVPAADLKELTDPTILTRRVWLETEWNKFNDGAHVVEETLGALWAWRISDNQDWSVRVKLPLKFRVGSNVPSASDIGGLSDFEVATGTALRLSRTWRIGGGLELAMPTGRHELSDNAWRIQEFGAVACDIRPWLTFSPSFEYNQSIAVEGNYPSIHFLETFVPFICTLPHQWAIAVGYENKADFENDNAVTHRGKILVAKELENIPLSFSISAKRDFNGGPKEFQINFIITYLFR